MPSAWRLDPTAKAPHQCWPLSLRRSGASLDKEWKELQAATGASAATEHTVTVGRGRTGAPSRVWGERGSAQERRGRAEWSGEGKRRAERGVEWSGKEWSDMAWNGVEWSGEERNGVERNGAERSAVEENKEKDPFFRRFRQNKKKHRQRTIILQF